MCCQGEVNPNDQFSVVAIQTTRRDLGNADHKKSLRGAYD